MTNPPRDLLMVRTHRANEASFRAYDRYAAESGFDVIFVCDERRGSVDVGDRDKVGFDAGAVEAMGLFPHADYGWRCGDYFHYVGRAARPDYARYWMIEPDVWIHTGDLRAWFEQFDDNSADLLVSWFGRKDPSWSWHASVVDRYSEVYGCTFPVTRLSAAASDHLLQARSRLGKDAAARETWPNDESFVASELMAAGFDCRDVSPADRPLYTRQSFRNAVPQDYETLVASEPDGLIHHPVQDWSAWLIRMANLINHAPRPLFRRGQAARIAGAGGGLRQIDAYAPASAVPMLIARSAYAARPWAEKGAKVDEAADRRSVEQIDRRFQEEFGVPSGGKKVADLQVVTGTTIKNPEATVRSEPGDFLLEPATPVGEFPARFALPYCWDLERRELLTTLHIRPETVLSEPFLYIAQRKQARVLGRVPLAELDRLYGPYDRTAAPILIFSVGRTGSTLLHALIRCAAPRAISEPDAFTQLATNKRAMNEHGEAEKLSLLWHSMSAFFTTQLDGGEGGPVSLKFRSQVNGLAEDLIAAFPQARSIFMLRSHLDWARSTFRVFNMEPQQAVGRLKQGLQTLAKLKRSPSSLIEVWYEDVVRDPIAAVGHLLNQPITPEVELRMREVMAADSQAGTRVGRSRGDKSREAEAAWMARFEEIWAEKRPDALIAELGLERLDRGALGRAA